ncbi:DUF4083 family protein [Bacillus sp. KH172YL63]|uniref:DUF4083 family protein n=1 Tax=Bacillus sp. KH172YL63 TaxID=2709784 RepID=UPI0013E49A9A|nr:DUF4083 family protein [Bacillus sp. KH172YL63]BCB05979.1 hypothetical protein KH172YL63_41120 [Bacillus sp. KH172YL63]
MNIGDVIFQLVMMALLVAMMVVVYMIAKSFRNRRIEQRKHDKQIEEKLDQILEKMDQTK